LKDILRYLIALPSPDEQIAIAAFLDRETARIDALIGHKDRLISLLEEKRQAVISHAVTRGLDPTAPLKDSGVPWLGSLPEHWEVRRLRHISPEQLVGVVVNPSTYVDAQGDIPFLFGSNVLPGGFSVDGVRRITPQGNKLIAKSILRAGDLVTVRVGAPGVTAVIPSELDGCNCASIMIIRRSVCFDSHWLCYAINSFVGKTNVELAQYGAAQEQFNVSHAVDFLFPVPPLIEQQAIAQYLHRRCKSVNRAATRIRDGIARLHEYRTALISAAVTGQIDVRGEVTP
jgi:type I restriction enzyme S subunit